MGIHHLVIALFVSAALCIVPLIGLIAFKTAKALQSAALEHVVRKNRSLISLIAAEDGAAKTDTIARLDLLKDRLVAEQLIDRAAAAAGRAIGDFREVYDAAGVTDRYLALLEKSKSWKKRAFAAEKLGRIGSAKALPALLSIIRDVTNEDEDVRGAALRALGRIRDERAIPFLIEALGYPDTWLPPRIGEILVSVGDPAIPFLQAELRRNPSEHVRMWSAEILGWLNAASAAAVLGDALSDISPEVRAKAAGALGKIKDDRSVNMLLELLVSDPVPFVRVKASQALGLIGHPAVIDYLINILKDPEWWVRVRAVEALEKLGDKAVAALLPALEDEDPEVRKRAAMALERIGYVEKILDEYGQPEFKGELRKILCLVAEAGIIESLGQKLMTADRPLKKRIVRILGEARVIEAAGPLLELLRETSEWSLKARIIESLGRIGAKEAIPHLVEHLKDEESWVRKAAVDSLGRLEAHDVTDDIARILDDPSPLAREAALEALLLLKSVRHREQIERLLIDPTPRVKQTAIRVMRELDLALNEETALALLTDASEEVQGETIKYFARSGDARRAADIARLLPHSSPSLMKEILAYFAAVPAAGMGVLAGSVKIAGLRPEALGALIEIASRIKSDEAHGFIAGFAGSDDPSIREKALTALARFGMEGNEAAIRSGLSDPAAQVRIAALARIAADPRRELLEFAQALATDPDENVRTALALALGASGLREFAPRASRMLDDASVKVGAGALISLAAFDDASFLETIRARWSLAQIKTAIHSARNDSRFASILELIGRNAAQSNNLEVAFILAENERDFTRDLIGRIKESHDPQVRLKAMEILALLPTGEYLTSILSIMKRDPLAELRVRAMEIVSATGREDERVSAVSSMLVDPSPAVRTRAAELLGGHGTAQALEALFHVLDTSDRRFREVVTTSLSTILADSPEKFAELLKSIPETKTRKLGMTWLLGKTRKRGAMKFLVNLMEDDDPEVRAAAVGALAKFKRMTLLVHFEKLLYDPSERVRAATVNAIAAIGGAAAYDLCARAVEDIDEFVRRRAALGLARIDERKALAVLGEKAASIPGLGSCVKGLLFAAGTSYDASVQDDSVARSIVAELCPEEEMRHAFHKSPDKSRRLHALRVLELTDPAGAPALAELALKDPSIEIREEAQMYAGR
ncbi:MAG: HEAT repeat domain-containing protein [Candidatus Krumholzibacteria bacterium]|nr:HEAT repeat domain-containing protein [Candidatus Krumholzibacteria bacterium]